RVFAEPAGAQAPHLRTRNGDHEIDLIVERDNHKALAVEAIIMAGIPARGEAMSSLTVTAADARAHFARIADQVSRTGEAVTVFKNSRPWVMIVPTAVSQAETELPPAVPRPNAGTRRSMAEGEAILARGARFEGYADLMAALEADDAAV
ncbi:MAG: type II toxin-antitoxin system Phd/YefM family antitoxin, partial [Propionibacteriaceae bacterium]|nr:type II toxin-antitoxin system Phd/YefM family antitoxin [Propionibacteriaceae bacterium]